MTDDDVFKNDDFFKYEKNIYEDNNIYYDDYSEKKTYMDTFLKDKELQIRDFSKNEINELSILFNISRIFSKNIFEINEINKVNELIIKKNMFVHYKFIPISVWIYVLYEHDIILFCEIITYKFKNLYNLKINTIKKKIKKFCNIINKEYIYNKNQKLTKYINGYYYIIKSSDIFFVDKNNDIYKTLYADIILFFTEIWNSLQIINIENFSFIYLYIFNKLVLIYQFINDTIYLNLNFELYNNIINELMSTAKFKKINELINFELYNKFNNIITRYNQY